MPLFRQKTVALRAEQWQPGKPMEGVCLHDIVEHVGCLGVPHIHARVGGAVRVAPGDWIIKGPRGDFYRCKPEVFAATYEPADDDGAQLRQLGPGGY